MKPIISDGISYHLKEEGSQWSGFGGRKFTILFNDGELVQTSNLWMDYKKPEGMADSATIHEGWGEPDLKNKCSWVKVNEMYGSFVPGVYLKKMEKLKNE